MLQKTAEGSVIKESSTAVPSLGFTAVTLKNGEIMRLETKEPGIG